MTRKLDKSSAFLEETPDEQKQADVRIERQIALLTAIIRIYRETLDCRSEEEVARICLKVAEELAGSAFGFIGELNPQGLFDTTTLGEAGWNACKIARPEADILL